MKVNPANYVGLTKAHADKVRSRCQADHRTGCLTWTGATTSKGYGNVVITVGERKRYLPPHRVAYVVEHPDLPPTLELDHVCRNRKCCNPAHLEPVTSGENTRRGESFAAVNARKTHCKAGHLFTDETTWRSPTTGRRKCRICQRDRRAKRYREVEAPAVKARTEADNGKD